MKNLVLILTLALLTLVSCQKNDEKLVKEEKNPEVVTEDEAIVNSDNSTENTEKLPEPNCENWIFPDMIKDEEGGYLLDEDEKELLPTKQEVIEKYGEAVTNANCHDYSYIPIIGGEISHVFKTDGDRIKEFNNGLKPIVDESDKLVYVDESGSKIIETGLNDMWHLISEYSMLPDGPTCDFSDGIAFLGDGRYMDTEGNMIYIENGCGMYKCGLIRVYEYDENGQQLYGYADINGEIKIPCKYNKANDFSENGLALVFDEERLFDNAVFNYYDDEYNPYRGYINTNGEEVIPLEYYAPPRIGARHMYPVSEMNEDGIVRLYKEGYYYYFNNKGEVVGKMPGKHWVSYQENGRSKALTVNMGMYYDSLKENKTEN